MSPSRFMIFWLASVIAFLAGAATFNAFMDPYAVFGIRRIEGFNFRKPTASNHSATVKAYQVERVAPHAVLIGASRVDIGLDPNQPSWPRAALPVYNYGVPGAGLQSMLLQLQHAAQAGELRVAVVGLDFENFLAPEVLQNTPNDERLRSLTAAATGTPNVQRARQRLLDMLRATLTLGATLDSIQTLAAQRRQLGPDISDNGATSEGAFALIGRSEGYHDLFAQKELQVVERYTGAARAHATFPAGYVANLDYVRSIIEFCRDHGIELYLFIHPLHATLLGMIESAGLWDYFEDWKRALVDLVEENRKGPDETSLILWDFAEYSPYTTEVRPEKGDRSTELKWFWEPGHYKKALGNLMLSRMLNSGTVHFGEILSRGTIGERLVEIRAGRQSYLDAYPREAARIAELVTRNRQH